MASVALAQQFRAHGYAAKVVLGNYGEGENDGGTHCWVISQDLAYDITHTQFVSDGPDVYVFRNDEDYTEIAVFDGEDTEEFWDYFNDWPNVQKPLKNRIEEIVCSVPVAG